MSILARYTTANMTSLLEEAYRFTNAKRYFYNRSKFIELDNKRGKLEVELPGFSSSEIEVYSENNTLSISAKKEDKSREYYNCWSISKDERVDKVKYENGLLTVEISLVEPEKPERTRYKIE